MSFEESVIGKSVIVRLFGEAAEKVEKKIFGDDCKDGDECDINTKVWFRYKDVEGRAVIEMEVAI